MVETGYHYAKLLSILGAERQRAMDILEVSLYESRAAGMRLWTEKLETLQAGILADTSAQLPAGLTNREMEVIRLVCEGMTDKQIGEKLFISPKTVGNHLRNIRDKTHCQNKVDVVRFATEHELI